MSKRKLTLLGRITIIKSLAVSKCVHLFILLPAPPNGLISELEKFQDFQYKINNNILVTNSFLAKINKIDSGVCSYCKEQPEKIHHLFLSCPKVKNFGRELREWLNTNIYIDLSLENREILFSYTGNNKLVTYIYALAKLFIYQNTFISRTINIQGFICLLKKKC